MTLTLRSINVLTAFLIALSAIALPSDIIDVFGLPVPRLLFGMSWFTILPVVVLAVLWPLCHQPRPLFVGLWDVAYLGTIAVWIVVEGARGDLRPGATSSAIFAWLSPWVVSVAARMHVAVYGDVRTIVFAFVRVVAVYALLHLALLILIRVATTLPLVRLGGIIGRNSISHLLVAAIFLMAAWEGRDKQSPSWHLIGAHYPRVCARRTQPHSFSRTCPDSCPLCSACASRFLSRQIGNAALYSAMPWNSWRGGRPFPLARVVGRFRSIWWW